MFRALLAHPQEALHKPFLVYSVRVMSVGCTRFGVELQLLALLAHPQEALRKRYLEYCVRVMSVGCTRTGVELQSWCSQLT
jgi:hypothetical protein